MEILKNSNSYLINDYSKSSIVIGNFQEYYLIKDNFVYKTIIGKNKDEIYIKSKNYIIKFNQKELSKLIGMIFNSLEDAFDFIIEIFEKNQVLIKDIIINKEMTLIITIEEGKKTIMKLLFNTQKDENKFNIINEINKMKNEIKDIKKENLLLKNEIDNLKKYNQNKKNNNFKMLSYLTSDSYGYSNLDNSFTIFKSISDILYLVYATYEKSIICYNLINQKKTIEIKNCHKRYITNFRHYLDKINKRDLIISISNFDNNLKIWDAYNWGCILNLLNANNNGLLHSAYILNEINGLYAVTSNRNKTGPSEHIKVFVLNGQKIKEINNSDENTFFIDIFYDNNLLINYIIVGNVGYIKSYDYNNNELYHKYLDRDMNNSNKLYCHSV